VKRDALRSGSERPVGGSRRVWRVRLHGYAQRTVDGPEGVVPSSVVFHPEARVESALVRRKADGFAHESTSGLCNVAYQRKSYAL
jgi:hypothetical protein